VREKLIYEVLNNVAFFKATKMLLRNTTTELTFAHCKTTPHQQTGEKDLETAVRHAIYLRAHNNKSMSPSFCLLSKHLLLGAFLALVRCLSWNNI